MMVVPGNVSYQKLFLLKNRAVQTPFGQWFSYGRYAFVYYMQYLEQKHQQKIKTVWLPDYICHEVVNSYRDYGYQVCYYALTDDLKIDINTLTETLKKAESHDVVLVCHFFGNMLQNLSEIAGLCRSQNLHLVEDCVHVPYTNLKESLPEYAEASMFSFRKIFAVPYGSVLTLKDEAKGFHCFLTNHVEQNKDQNMFGVVRWILREYFKWVVLKLKIPIKRGYVDLSLDPLKKFNFAHPWVEKMLQKDDWITCQSRRRENYQFFLKCFSVSTDWIKPFVFDLNKDCPYQFLLVLKQGVDRVHFLKFFLARGVAAQLGLALHKDVLDDLPGDHIYNRHVTLPLHHGVTQKQIQYMCTLLKQYEEEFVNESF